MVAPQPMHLPQVPRSSRSKAAGMSSILGGAMRRLLLGLATLSDAHWSLSSKVVLMSLLGGMGAFAGPVVGERRA